MGLSDLERPFITTSVAASSLEGTVATIKQAENAGARAFEIHLPLLGFPDADTLSELTDVTAAPMYATCRRDDFYELLGDGITVERTDSERIDALVDAVATGFDGVDFELDTFDPTPGPREYTTDAIAEYAAAPGTDLAELADSEDAVRKQRKAVDRVHGAGGEVILSAHTYNHLDPADAVAVARRATERGGDFVKIVGVDRDIEEALETLETHLRLNEADIVPYALMAIGDSSRITRPLSPMFGSAWVFTQPSFTPGGFHSWPLVEDAREILRRVDWRTAYDPHSGDR